MLEELLKVLKELVVAINANTAAQKGAKAKKSEAPADTTPAADTPAPAAEPPAPTGPTLPTILATAQQILDKGGLEKIRAINAKLGIKKISECPPEKFVDLDKALTALKEELESV